NPRRPGEWYHPRDQPGEREENQPHRSLNYPSRGCFAILRGTNALGRDSADFALRTEATTASCDQFPVVALLSTTPISAPAWCSSTGSAIRGIGPLPVFAVKHFPVPSRGCRNRVHPLHWQMPVYLPEGTGAGKNRRVSCPFRSRNGHSTNATAKADSST